MIFNRRSSNMIVHMLAQATYSMTKTSLMKWYHTAPEFICNLISKES